MHAADAAQLGLVLDAFELGHKVRPLPEGDVRIFLQRPVKRVADAGRVGQHGLPAAHGLQERRDFVISAEGDAVCPQAGRHAFRHAGGIDEQDGLVRQHGGERDRERAVLHVARAQVHQPRHAVQPDVDLRIRPALLQLFAHQRDFFRAGQAGVFHVVQEGLGVRHGRAVFPERPRQVEGPDFKALFPEEAGHFPHVGRGEQRPVQADRPALRKFPVQERGAGRHAAHAHAVQLDSAAGKLPLRLDEVPPVGPQAALFPRDGQRPRRAREPRKVPARFPVLGRILAQVGVRRRDDVRLHAGFFHGGTQCGDSF